jgi:hypothetical protein
VRKTKATKKAIEGMLHRLDQNLLDVMGWSWEEFQQARVAMNSPGDGWTRYALDIGKNRIGNTLNASEMYEALNILNQTIEHLFAKKLKEMLEKRVQAKKAQTEKVP